MQQHWKSVGLLAAAVLLGIAAVSFRYNVDGPVDLMLMPSGGPATGKLVAKTVSGQEIAAAQAQARLAQKDARIFKSLALAAKQKMQGAAKEDQKFVEAKEKHMMLDARLAQLSQRFEAQKQALEYMVPDTEHQAFNTERMAMGVNTLKQSLEKLTKDINAVGKEVEKTKDMVKPTRAELKTSEEILAKAGNAYKLFGDRVQQSREKADLAREQVQQLDQGAMLAQQYATELRKQALSERDKKRAELIAQEASKTDAKVDMLKKQAAEAMQSAQLFDAEADEALSYMSMFGTDAQQAHAREGAAEQKLNFLAANYEKGKQLEAMAQRKQAFLQAQLSMADKTLMAEVKRTKEAEAAVLTGERATARTGEALKIDHAGDVQDAKAAVGDIASIHQDEVAYDEDAVQARTVASEAWAHKMAAKHLDEAAEASSDEQHDEQELHRAQ